MVLQSAVVGAGNSAVNGHLPALQRNPSTELVAVCDLDESRAREAADEFDTDWYADFDALLAEEDLDWLHICTPVQTHFDLAYATIEQGIHTLVQKPVTQSVAEMEDLLSLANEHDVSVSAVHNRAFFPVMRELRKEIESGGFGEVVAVNTILAGEGRPDETPRGSWVFDLPGGELEEGFPHPIYLTLMTGGYPAAEGDIRSISRCRDTYDKDIDYDGVTVSYESERGALCSITVLSESVPRDVIRVYGTNKSATVDLNAMIYVDHEKDSESPVTAMADSASTSLQMVAGILKNGLSFGRMLGENRLDRHTDDSVSGTYYQINETARAIEDGTEQPVPPAQALWTMKLMRAIRETVTNDSIDASPTT